MEPPLCTPSRSQPAAHLFLPPPTLSSAAALALETPRGRNAPSPLLYALGWGWREAKRRVNLAPAASQCERPKEDSFGRGGRCLQRRFCRDFAVIPPRCPLERNKHPPPCHLKCDPTTLLSEVPLYSVGLTPREVRAQGCSPRGKAADFTRKPARTEREKLPPSMSGRCRGAERFNNRESPRTEKREGPLAPACDGPTRAWSPRASQPAGRPLRSKAPP